MNARGFTLTELLVAMTATTLLISGALAGYAHARRQLQRAEQLADLDERALFAFAELGRDVHLADFWGLHHEAADIAVPADVAARCGAVDATAWAFALSRPVATNDPPPCPLAAVPNSGALTVRRATASSTTPETGVVQLEATSNGGELFADGIAPTGATDTRVHDLRVHHWFVSARSSEADNPALRRLSLTRNGMLMNEEIMPGIANLNVTFGLDTDGDGVIDHYAGDSAAGEVRAVKLELELVADRSDALLAGSSAPDERLRVRRSRLIAVRNKP